MEWFDKTLKVEENFDLLKRVFRIGDRQACFYLIDGFHKDDTLQKLLQYYAGVTAENTPQTMDELLEKHMPYGEVELLRDIDALIGGILSGKPVLLVDGFSIALTADFREYPARNVSEPDKDKSMRGSKDGFVETLVFNTALIRRRIRTPELMIKMLTIGSSSRTDVAICYMDNRVDHKFLEKVLKKIESIDVDSLTMNQQSLAECMFHGSWFNPFPKFKYTERPDVASASIFEGSVILLVDNSPSAMILPANIFDIVEEADDYYFPPVTGTYLRLSRIFIDLLAVVLTPLFLLITDHPEYVPESFQFIMIEDPMNIPILWQFLILEFMVDGLRLASINTPNMLSTPLSVISGLVIGEFAVGSGWFNSEAMLYMAFVTIANYTQVNFELGYALKFMRVITMLLTSFFGLGGLVTGLLFTVFCICTNRTIAGKSYVYPLIPFSGKELLRRIFRFSIRKVK